jgi:hypothetical protein
VVLTGGAHGGQRGAAGMPPAASSSSSAAAAASSAASGADAGADAGPSGLLGGEIVIDWVSRVLRYTTAAHTSGEYGSLYITNFRVVFVQAESNEVGSARLGHSLCPPPLWPLPLTRNVQNDDNTRAG